MLDGKPVLDIGAFSAAIRQAAGKTLQLDVRRDGTGTPVELDIATFRFRRDPEHLA